MPLHAIFFRFCRSRLYQCRRGSAAVEMVLVLPLLTTLLFGSVELGRYFLNEHALLKAVREAARFAARQNFADMPCNSQPVPEQAAAIRSLVRFGNVAGTGSPRRPYWRADANVTVSIACVSGNWSGLYAENQQGAPVVTVSAVVPYVSLFGTLGLNAYVLHVRAEAQSAVMGL